MNNSTDRIPASNEETNALIETTSNITSASEIPTQAAALVAAVISDISEINLESEEYRSPSVKLCLSDGVIFFARPTDQMGVGGLLHSYSVWKADFQGNKIHIGDFECYATSPYMAADTDCLYFAVTEAVNEQMVYEGQYANVIYRIRLKDLSMEEVYRSKETLPGFYMDVAGSRLMIRQARRDGESYTTWIECYDPEKREVLFSSEDYTSVNGIGRYMLNLSVEGEKIYGLLTERDQADDDHETLSVVILDENLKETERIRTDEVKDYLINTYPYRFHVRNGIVEVTNGNQSETLIAAIRDGALMEIFRRQNVQQTFTNEKDAPWIFFDLPERIVYTCDPKDGAVSAAKIVLPDQYYPMEIYPAGETVLVKANNDVKGPAFYYFNREDIPFENVR